MSDDTTTYELRRGTYRIDRETKLTPGDTVELTDRERALHAREKFSRVEPDGSSIDEIRHHVTPDESAADTEAEMEPDASIPDEWRELRALAAAYDGPEIDGSSNKEEIQSFLDGLPADDLAALKRAATT